MTQMAGRSILEPCNKPPSVFAQALTFGRAAALAGAIAFAAYSKDRVQHRQGIPLSASAQLGEPSRLFVMRKER